MSSGSHLSLFHILFTLLLTLPWLDLSSSYSSNVCSSWSRTFLQPFAICFSSAFCSLRSSRSERTTSTSRRTIERLLTLFQQRCQHCSKCGQGSVLVRNSLELAWRVDELLADLVGKLDYGDEVAYTKTEAHRDSSTALLLAYRIEVRESGMRKSRNRRRFAFRLRRQVSLHSASRGWIQPARQTQA